LEKNDIKHLLTPRAGLMTISLITFLFILGRWIPYLYGDNNNSRKELVNQKECCFCLSELVIASKANCKHYFCYYCLAANIEADPEFICPVCKVNLSAEHIKPVKLL
jgi:hypothetical protein